VSSRSDAVGRGVGQVEQSRGGDGARGSIHLSAGERPAFGRVVIPRRYAIQNVGRRILEVVTGVEHLWLQRLDPPGLQIRAREPVKRPGQAAAPARIAAIALMR